MDSNDLKKILEEEIKNPDLNKDYRWQLVCLIGLIEEEKELIDITIEYAQEYFEGEGK